MLMPVGQVGMGDIAIPFPVVMGLWEERAVLDFQLLWGGVCFTSSRVDHLLPIVARWLPGSIWTITSGIVWEWRSVSCAFWQSSCLQNATNLA